MYRLIPYLGAWRIVTEGAPAGQYVEQHGDHAYAEARLAKLNAKLKHAPPPAPVAPVDGAPSTPAPTVAPVGTVVDLTILDGKLGDLAAALGSGAHDAYLGELLAAENDGKTRKGAVRIIESRIAETA